MDFYYHTISSENLNGRGNLKVGTYMSNPLVIFTLLTGISCLILIVSILAYALYRWRKKRTNQLIEKQAIIFGEKLLDISHPLAQLGSEYSRSGSSNTSRDRASPVHMSKTIKPHPLLIQKYEKIETSNDYKTFLQFAVRYQENNEVLNIKIIACLGLYAQGSLSAMMDSYVKLQLLPEKLYQYKTRICRNCTNPHFGEEFTVKNMSPYKVKSTKIHFLIVIFDNHSHEQVYGEVLYSLENIEISNLNEVKIEQEVMPKISSTSYKPRGQLLVSICYHPTANRMTVVILKARDLPIINYTGEPCSPYIKLYFMMNNQRLAKKKTHVKKCTSNPTFNEVFTFDVPEQKPPTEFSVDFKVVHWNPDAPGKIIGQVSIGTNATLAGARQWMTAIEGPRKQVAEWHTVIG